MFKKKRLNESGLDFEWTELHSCADLNRCWHLLFPKRLPAVESKTQPTHLQCGCARAIQVTPEFPAEKRWVGEGVFYKCSSVIQWMSWYGCFHCLLLMLHWPQVKKTWPWSTINTDFFQLTARLLCQCFNLYCSFRHLFLSEKFSHLLQEITWRNFLNSMTHICRNRTCF